SAADDAAQGDTTAIPLAHNHTQPYTRNATFLLLGGAAPTTTSRDVERLACFSVAAASCHAATNATRRTAIAVDSAGAADAVAWLAGQAVGAPGGDEWGPIRVATRLEGRNVSVCLHPRLLLGGPTGTYRPAAPQLLTVAVNVT